MSSQTSTPSSHGGPIRHNRKDRNPSSFRPGIDQMKGVKSDKYVFTWNNYPDDAQDQLKAMFEKKGGLWLINSEEIAPTTGTPHLQGFVSFRSKIHWTALDKCIRGISFKPAASKNIKDQWDYIMKNQEKDGDDFVFYEYGTRPQMGLSTKQLRQRQNNADKNKEMWENVREAAKEGRFEDIPAQIFISHMKNIKQIYTEHKNKLSPMENVILKPWQAQLEEIAMQEPDDRTIHWYWSKKGKDGKSFMATYFLRNHGATVLSNGKCADIAYLLDSPKIVIFDISRERSEQQNFEQVNFGVMEDIKNGRIFSPKYESTIKCFDSPHLIVFANAPCPYGKFSEDRIKEVNIPDRVNELEEEELRRVPPPVLRRTDPIVAIGDGDSIWSPPLQEAISEEENRENIRKWILDFENIPSPSRLSLGSFVSGFNKPN